MLPSLDFTGSAEVINKGVDITLVTNQENKDKIFDITRNLVVRGFSTALLCVTELEPVDMKTIRYYEKTTPLLVFLDEAVGEAVIPQLHPETPYLRQYHYTRDDLVRMIPEWIRKYRKRERGI